MPNMLKTDKFKIMLDNVVAGVLSDAETLILYFIDGSSLTVEQKLFDEVFSSSPDFFPLTERAIINKKHILYVKNNLENPKASKAKVTVSLPKRELYRAFTDKKQAQQLFASL